MTREEALEKLELEVGASQQEIQQQYQEFYNEFQTRITNAPTTHQKTLYQKKLKQLEDAFTLLSGKETETLDADLPWSSPGETTTGAQRSSFHATNSNNITKAQAIELLGLQESFTKGKLVDAYRVKKNQCEAAIKNAFNEEMAESGKKALKQLTQAHELLLPLVKASVPKSSKPNKAVASEPKAAKKSSPILWIVLFVVAVAGALFVLKPWEDKIDPEVLKLSIALKAEANLLAKQQNWQEALAKYEAANKLLPSQEVKDSITSIKKRLEAIALAAETKAWEVAEKTNTIEGYKAYMQAYQDTVYSIKAYNAIAKIEAYLKSESGRKKLAAEQKQKALAKAKERIKNKPAIQSLLSSFVYVRGGTFSMGCTSEQSNCDGDEKPVHSVSVSGFNLGKYEVTQAQWEELMDNNPSKNNGCSTCPVEQVSWNDIQDFIKKLQGLTGKRFRLPTEAEWEYAVRGGNRSEGYKYAGSNNVNSVAWYDSNSGKKTHPVGRKQANALGLYDMSGNVWEWCSDWYGDDYYSNSSSNNPRGPGSGKYRVLRGGSWGDFAARSRVANRDGSSPSFRNYYIGFRLVTY